MESYQTNHVQIFDTTLRDGEQSPGIALSNEEKVIIAKQLGNLGIDVIEAGFPINSKTEFDAVKSVAQEAEGPVVTALARAQSLDITKAAEAIKDAEKPRIHTFISSSDIHIEKQLSSTREDVLGQARASVAQAKTFVDDVEFSPMDASRGDKDYTAEVVQVAIDEGATVINIPDTVGWATPDEYRELFEYLIKEVNGSEKVIWSAHCHNDLGLAVANSYSAVLGGARQVEGTITGIGERAGNTSLEELIMLIESRGKERGLMTNINTKEIGPTARLISRLTGYPIPPSKAVIGRNAFAHESGIHQDGVLKDASTYEIMDPKSVGWEGEQIEIGKHSGRHAVISTIENLPFFDKQAAGETFRLFKGFRDKVGSVTKEQLIEIHDEAKRRLSASFELDDPEFSSDNNAGHVTGLMVDKTTKEKIKYQKTSELGPISALISALQEATKTSYKIENVGHESIGKTENAIDKATVEIRINGKTIIGNGLSTNTVKATGLAYLDAISRVNQ